jgi:uncharacterized membrane protein YfcA
MALFGVAPDVMKPTALTLNLLVASIGSFKFNRAGHFSWPVFWPFALTSVPFAFVGGRIALPVTVYRPLLGAVLLYSAARFLLGLRGADETRPFPRWAALALGAVIGLLSGLTGVGGGIFLSPILLLMHWATTRTTAATSVHFILVNSAAGLAGHLSSVAHVHPMVPVWAAIAGVGGWIGSELGSRRLPPPILRRLLAVVLVIAGLKLILT